MDNRDKGLPADADANRNKEDIQNQSQEEFDDQSKQLLDENARGEQQAKNKSEADSQQKHEDMIPPEKKKQSDKWDKVNRQFPNLKR